ncbi:MAG: hypothetical protein A2086_16860 [Spirochaetes bacterium GWD1_27_9]|nr:MAG: hypothetical protein A2Z98_08180 [Spirochaetes bacterium GWB1_27_13]OHD20252.1 MAG: hypothetical protein A2Y34_04945 [Spirochaetes bacterium GWC1_27_15]OHD33459.1 MAG: hypothetical protein A2086_16860 [Spirochaetes bacterium GWD1_27_9]
MKKSLFLIFFVLFSYFLFSDESHYINIFVGDRAASMGGAYTAVADGPEGVFYNPAGLAFSSSRYFSLSVNAVQFKMLKYNNVFKKTDGTPLDYTRYSFSFIPNFFGFIQKEKHFTFAITITSPDSEFYDQRDNAQIYFPGTNIKTNFNTNFNYTNMLYEGGVSFAFLPHKRVSLGFSALIRYRDIKLISQTTYKSDSSEKSYDIYDSGSIFNNDRIIGLNSQFGIQIMPIDKLSIGYSISVPVDFVNIYSKQSSRFTKRTDLSSDGKTYILTHDSSEVVNNEQKVDYIFQKDNNLFRPIIIKQSLGFAIFVTKSILITIDGFLYIPIQDIKYYNNKAFENQRLNIIGNVSTGFECYVTPNFPIRLGFFTNFSNAKEIKITGKYEDGKKISNTVNQEDYIHLFGGSFSLGYSSSNLSINFGGVFSGGEGYAQIAANLQEVQVLDAFLFNVFISGGYQF